MGGAAGKSGAAAGARSPAAAGSGGAMSTCNGKGCGECTVDADCERRGIAGGTCIDTTCYPPMQHCSADKDCESLGPEYVGGRCVTSQCRPNPKWRCEPTPQWPAAMGIKELSLPVIDALSLNPLSDVHIVACNKLDYTCAMPVTEANSGKDGSVKLSVPDNFMGYVQETGRTDYAPGMYFLPPALPQDGKLPNWPLLPSGAVINALAVALGANLDPMRGHMMLIADDCFGMTLANVTFTSPQMDKSTVQFYVRDGVPNNMVKDTPPEGDGGYLNFPAGTALITATETKTGIELATVSAIVRPGFITTVYIRPMARSDH